MVRTNWAVVLGLALTVAVLGQRTAGAAVTVKDAGETRAPGRSGKYAGREMVDRTITLANERVNYQLAYQACTQPLDPQHQAERAGDWSPGYGIPMLGLLPGPGWYPGGFLNVRVNGEDLEHYLAEFAVYPEAGAFSMTFREPAAVVRLIFKLREGDDKLLLRCELEPVGEIRSVEVILLAYPAGFSRPRERRLLTPQGDWTSNGAPDAEAGKPVELDAGRNSWLMPYDGLLDVARVGDTSDGPCMAVLAPGEGSAIRADVREYPEFIFASYPATTRAFHLAFQKFRGWTNSRAAAYMKTNGAAFSAELGRLAQADFLHAPALASLPASPDPLRPPYLPGAEEQKRGLVVWRAVPFETIKAQDTPTPSRVLGGLSVLAAPGEYEAATFVLYGLRDLRGVKVLPSALTAASGDVLPAAAVELWGVRRVSETMPHAILVKDLGQVLEGTHSRPARHPEVLLSLPRGESRQIWCRVQVPAGAKPGHYTGRVRITTEAGERAELPLEVEVVPVSLPNPPQVRGVYFRPHLGPAEGQEAWEMSEGQLRRVLADMVDHGLNAAAMAEGPEDNPLRWGLGTEGKWTCRLVKDKSLAHTGQVTAVLTTDDQEGHASLSRRAEPIVAGRDYTFTGWVRGKGAAWVWLQWHDAQGKYLSTSGVDVGVTEEWQQVAKTVTAPEKAAAVSVRPGIGGKNSEVYWDDLALAPAGGGETLLQNGGFEAEAQTPAYNTLRRTLALRREVGLTGEAMSMGWGGRGGQFSRGDAVAGMVALGKEMGIPLSFYAWDEPAPNHFPSVKRVCEAIASGGGASAAAIGYPKEDREELMPFLTNPIFAIEWGYFYSPRAYEEAAKWWHDAGHRVYYYWQIWGDPLLQNRLWSGLYLYNGGYDGYYAYAHSDYSGDPFSDKDGKQDAFVAIPTAEGPPVATLHWEAMRAGTNDLRYIYAVKQRIEKLASTDRAGAQALEERLQTILRPFDHDAFVTRSPLDFVEAKRKLAELAAGA